MSLSSVEKLEQAEALLREVAGDQACKWCRSHVILVADEISDLAELAAMSEEARNNPGVLKAFRTLGEKAEELRVMAVIAHLARNRVLKFIIR